MSDFKGRHFGGEIVLWAVRWYCRYPISYRDLETMMTERGVAVGHHRFKSAGVIYCGQQTIVPFASGHSVPGMR